LFRVIHTVNGYAAYWVHASLPEVAALLESDVSNTGDYASQCTPVSQFGNTGNFDNGSSFVQYDGEIDDFEPGGIGVGFGGSNSVGCPSTVQQSSAASST
jgi:hypothetical protein